MWEGICCENWDMCSESQCLLVFCLFNKLTTHGKMTVRRDKCEITWRASTCWHEDGASLPIILKWDMYTMLKFTLLQMNVRFSINNLAAAKNNLHRRRIHHEAEAWLRMAYLPKGVVINIRQECTRNLFNQCNKYVNYESNVSWKRRNELVNRLKPTMLRIYLNRMKYECIHLMLVIIK